MPGCRAFTQSIKRLKTSFIKSQGLRLPVEGEGEEEGRLASSLGGARQDASARKGIPAHLKESALFPVPGSHALWFSILKARLGRTELCQMKNSLCLFLRLAHKKKGSCTWPEKHMLLPSMPVMTVLGQFFVLSSCVLGVLCPPPTQHTPSPPFPMAYGTGHQVLAPFMEMQDYSADPCGSQSR